MVAFIQEHTQLVSTKIGLGVKRVVVKHQWEVGSTVEGTEKFQNHRERIGEIIGARNQAAVESQLLGIPGQSTHFFQIGVGQAHDDGLACWRVPSGKLHQFQALVQRERDDLTGSPTESVAVEFWKQVLEKLQQTVEVNFAVVKWSGNDGQRAGKFQGQTFSFHKIKHQVRENMRTDFND